MEAKFYRGQKNGYGAGNPAAGFGFAVGCGS